MSELFLLIEGMPRNGKTLYASMLTIERLERNIKINELYGIKRHLYTNIKLMPWIEEKYKDWFSYWSEEHELYKLEDCDIIWDECQIILEARDYAQVSRKMLGFLAKYAKRGIEIIGITQDFGNIDARARQRITRCIRATKLIGSPTPSPTRPPILKPWEL